MVRVRVRARVGVRVREAMPTAQLHIELLSVRYLVEREQLPSWS